MDKPFDSQIENEKIAKEEDFVKETLRQIEMGNQYLNEIDLLVKNHKK
jgi:hypothetical protein